MATGPGFVTVYLYVTGPGPDGNARGVGTFLTLIRGGAVGEMKGGTEAHVGAVMTSLSVVTVPPNANALPTHVVAEPTVIPDAPMTVPVNVVFAASVVAAPGVQKTSHVEAPANVIIEPAVELSAPVDRKIYVPLPLSVRGPPTVIAPVTQ